MNQKEKRYDALTALKGIFIIAIAIFHFESEVGKPYNDILRPVCNFAWYYGNQFFFMVSGFLMCMAYRLKISEGKTDITSFLSGRVRKIWPLYFLTNIFTLVCFIVMSDGWREEFQLKRLISTCLMVSAGWVEDIFPYNFPTWFICVLILCYLVFYGISRLHLKHRDLYYAAVTGLIAWGYILMIMDWSAPFCYHHDGEGFFNFFTGVLSFDIIAWVKKNTDEKRMKLIHMTVIAVLAALQVLYLVFGTEEVCGDIQFVSTLFVLPLVIFLATTGGSIVRRIFECRPLVAIGNSSMYIFYFHVPVLTVYGIINYHMGYSILPETGMVAYVLALAAICVGSGIIKARIH